MSVRGRAGAVTDRAIEVVRPGALTTVQDGGRPGLAHLGVPPSGALDVRAWRLGNRLLGNGADAAALETTLDGVGLRALCDCAVAVTGAPAEVRVDGRPAAWGAAVTLAAGATLDVGRATAGLRSYVAVDGGLETTPVLGSRSRDVLSGLGPAPLAAGDRLGLGPRGGPPPPVDTAPAPGMPESLQLTLWDGPRRDRLTDPGGVAAGTWTVASASNRVGLRLEGPALALATEDELASEGLVTGAVQVPPDGLPIIFLRDHPTTGGYPVIGVIDASHLSDCGQARPGTVVRLRPRSVPVPPS